MTAESAVARRQHQLTKTLESDDAAGSDMDTHPTRSNHPPHHPPTHLQQITQQTEQPRTGWVCLHGRIVSAYHVGGATGEEMEFDVTYSWNQAYYKSRDDAIAGGWHQANSDDFNVGYVEDGVLTWFGWMDKQHPVEDYAAVAEQHGWDVPRRDQTVTDPLTGPIRERAGNPMDPQDEGEQDRQGVGIDGTMGDAQDVAHQFKSSRLHGGCRLCGLAIGARVHL